MPKGSTGTSTSTIIRMKKPEKVECDCSRCRWSKRGSGVLFCTYYNTYDTNRKTCARYWCVKPAPKKKNKKK